MTWLSLLALPLAALASYLSALGLSLVSFSPSAFQRHVAARGRPDAGTWLTDRVDDAVSSVMLVRAAVLMVMVGVLAVDIIGIGEQITVSVGSLVTVLAIGAALTWFSVSLVAHSLARYGAETLVSSSLPLLRMLVTICTPLRLLTRGTDESIRRLAGASESNGGEDADHRLLQRIEDEKLLGSLDEDAHAMLENVVEFRSTDVGEVMTPRTDIEGLEAGTTLDAARDFIEEAGHSRIPIYREHLDHIEGILYVKDLVRYLGRDAKGFDITKVLRAPTFVPDSMPVSDLLRHFQRSEVHMAIVVDEYGGTAGLVTIEDVLEEIVGEIYDEHEGTTEDEPSLDQLDDRHAEVDGRFHIDDLNDRLKLDLPEDEEFDTIGGFVLATLGHVPQVGEQFVTENIRFTALAATETQIDRIGIELLDEEDVSAGK